MATKKSDNPIKVNIFYKHVMRDIQARKATKVIKDCSSDLFQALDLLELIKEGNVTIPADYSVRWFTKAKCVFWYDMKVQSAIPSNVLTGSARIPVTVTMEFKNGRWVVVDIFEPL